jgi:integrase
LSTRPPSRTRPARAQEPSTLADLLALVEADVALPLRRRQDQASAIRIAAKALGRPPQELPANPTFLKGRLSAANPAMAGLSPRRWQNVLCLMRSALKRAGVNSVPGRNTAPLSASWADLVGRLKDKSLRAGLSRLAHYFSERGLEPTAMDERVIEKFERDLEDSLLLQDSRWLCRGIRIAWNRAADQCPAWPPIRLAVPSREQRLERYSLSWDAFPDSLKKDIDAWLRGLSGEDLLADSSVPTLRSSTRRQRDYNLRQFASALALRGHDPSHLRSLADLVAVETVKDGMRFFLERSSNKPTGRICALAHTLRAIARDWVKADQAHVEKLTAICRRLDPGRRGMTAKNRVLLGQFNSERNVALLLNLPAQILREIQKNPSPTATDAVTVQVAVAIELLIMNPMRIGNLVALDLGRHVVRVKRKKETAVYLTIPAAEVKNSTDIEAELPQESVALLDTYLDRFRPLLASSSSPWPFPGRTGIQHKARNLLADQIKRVIARKTGLRVNPHLFRHIAAKLYLDRNPGGYGLIRLVHGHQSVETTTRFYCGTEGPAAMRHFDEHVLELRAQTTAHGKTPGAATQRFSIARPARPARKRG